MTEPTYEELKAKIAQLEAKLATPVKLVSERQAVKMRLAELPAEHPSPARPTGKCRKRNWILEREYRKIRAQMKKRQKEYFAKRQEEERQHDLKWAEQGRRLKQAKQEHPITYFFGKTETQRQVFAERAKQYAFPIPKAVPSVRVEPTQTDPRQRSKPNNNALGMHLILFAAAAISFWVSYIASRGVLDVLIRVGLITVWAAEGLAKARATRIERAWYAAFFMASYAVVAFTVAYGIIGLLGGILGALIWIWTFWTKDTHFIR